MIAATAYCTHIGGLDGRQGVASKFIIDISAREIINNDDLVSLIAEVERSGPSTETIASKDDNFFRSTGAIGTVFGKKLRGETLGLDSLERSGERRSGDD